MSKLKLGSRAKDKITGFEGIITGRAEYLTGCDQYVLQPECKSTEEYPEGKWFDEGRLTSLSEEAIFTQEDVKADKDGCDYSAPIK